MLMNATLLRVDDPLPAPPGADIAVRCSAGTPTASEVAALGAMGMHASAVLYLGMDATAALPGGMAPSVNQLVMLQLDGCPPETYVVVHASDRVGDVLSHVQLFLAEPT